MKNSYYYDGNNYSYDELKKLFDRGVEEHRRNPDERITMTLNMLEGECVLDVGCAGGGLSRLFAEKVHKVHAIDVLPDSIAVAQTFNKSSNITYEVRDVLEKPFPPETFDCITFLETIEHVENPALFFKEFHRILKKNGHLILSTPNATSIKNIVYALSYRTRKKQNRLKKEIYNEPRKTGTQIEHIYNWDFVTLIRLLDRCGFDIADHGFARSGPVIISIFGKKIKIIGGNSKILDSFPTLKTTLVIKARKRD